MGSVRPLPLVRRLTPLWIGRLLEPWRICGAVSGSLVKEVGMRHYPSVRLGKPLVAKGLVNDLLGVEALNGSILDVGVMVHQGWFQNVFSHTSW
jgi:hypothetical protein